MEAGTTIDDVRTFETRSGDTRFVVLTRRVDDASTGLRGQLRGVPDVTIQM